MNINDIAITSLEVITAFDVTTGAYMFTLDELQNASIKNSEDKQDIVGKQGRKITSLKKNKAVTVSGSNGMLSSGLLAAQAGAALETKETIVMWTDYLTVKTQSANTKYKAIGDVGSEISALYIKNADGTLGKVLTQGSNASDGVFKYEPTSKKLTFHSNVEDNTEIVVYYKRKISADTMENLSDKHATKVSMYIDAIGEDKCANVYRIQFFIPKADFSGNYSIDMGDNQTIHNFEAEGLAGGCGESNALWTYTIFGENTEDAKSE